MNNIKILLLSAVVAFTAAACNSSSPDTAVDTGATSTQEVAPVGTATDSLQ